ncbi:cupredoxin domain-containing protein [Paramagnetospirillum marisnigri]|nr:quinol oxidase [Paramagnetospirillum marisnigri]
MAATLVLLASLILLAGWLAGRTGSDILPSTAYRVEGSDFGARLAAQGASGVVRVPPGDVYMTARRWEFSPALELAPGGAYRLHLLSEDVVHSAAIGDAEVLLEPGTVRVVSLTAPPSGRVRIQCAEYCGLGHTKMIGSIEVVP